MRKSLKGLLSNIGYCLRLSWSVSPFYTCVRFISRVAAAVIPLGITWCTKNLIDTLTSGGKRSDILDGIFYGILCYGLFSVMNVVMQKWNTYVTGVHNDKLNHVLEKKMMEQAVYAELEMFDEPEFYDRYENARRNTYVMGTAVWNVIDMFSTAIAFVSAFCILCGLQPITAIIFVLVSIPSVLHDYQYTKDIYNLECSNVDNERKRNYFYRLATERMYTQDVRLFGIEKGILRRYEKLWHQFITLKCSMVKKHAWKNLLLSLPAEICTLGILWIVAVRIVDGENTLGDFSLYLGVVSQLVSTIYIMITSLASIRESQLKIENVREFHRYSGKKMEDGEIVLAEQPEIKFSHVSFRYPGTRKMVLNDMSFTIRPGERIALVGLNGSGKTTIIKLMLRFYDVTDGEILYNGIPIRAYSRLSIRRQFSVLFQDFVNYAFTVKENIRLEEGMNGSALKADERYHQAIKESGMEEIIGELSFGDQTYVTRMFDEQGEEFSRGQYQKLALARALYREAGVVLLDEPSAALDPKSEYEIFRAMDTYCRGKTAMFITHRLDNVCFADRIIYIENGRMKEEGTEEELLRQEGSYAELWKISRTRVRSSV